MSTIDNYATKKNCNWTNHEDQRLHMAVEECGERWKDISVIVGTRDADQCRQRWTKVSKPGIVKGRWNDEENNILQKIVPELKQQKSMWKLASIEMKKRGFDRTCKQCREHWYNQLDPDLDRSDFSVEEDKLLLVLQKAYGSRWAKITKQLPKKRSANAVKMRCKKLNRFEYERTPRKKQQIMPVPSPLSGSIFPQRSPIFAIPIQITTGSYIALFPTPELNQSSSKASTTSLKNDNLCRNQELTDNSQFLDSVSHNFFQSQNVLSEEAKLNKNMLPPKYTFQEYFTQKNGETKEKIETIENLEDTAPPTPSTEDFGLAPIHSLKIDEFYPNSEFTNEFEHSFSDLLEQFDCDLSDSIFSFLEHYTTSSFEQTCFYPPENYYFNVSNENISSQEMNQINEIEKSNDESHWI